MRNEIRVPGSRRGLLKTGLGLVAGGLVLAASQARADDKVEQSVVQYQGTPKDGAQCSGCVNFVAPNACTVVAGNISPSGWCVAYAPKGS